MYLLHSINFPDIETFRNKKLKKKKVNINHQVKLSYTETKDLNSRSYHKRSLCLCKRLARHSQRYTVKQNNICKQLIAFSGNHAFQFCFTLKQLHLKKKKYIMHKKKIYYNYYQYQPTDFPPYVVKCDCLSQYRHKISHLYLSKKKIIYWRHNR